MQRTRIALSGKLRWYCLLVGLGALQPQTAESQRNEPAGDCGAEICLQTGESNWRLEPAEYCEAGVCLRDSLESLVGLDWDRVTAGLDALIAADANPFIGLTDDEYRRLRLPGNDDVKERLRLLGRVRTSCRPAQFSARLEVPGYDTVIVTFAVAPASEPGRQRFQVTTIDRTFRGLPGGSVSAWIRWISYRFPGVELMGDGVPTTIASYEIGLYIGRLVLLDTEFRYGQPADYARHSDCAAR
jgi:hypothetical protein